MYMNELMCIKVSNCRISRLKKFFQKDINYKYSDEFIKNSKRLILGNIPPEIIRMFNQDKANKIKIFQDALAQTAFIIRGTHKKLKHYNIINNSIEELEPAELNTIETNISNFFNIRIKDIMPKGYIANFEFSGKGAFANVFKFSLKNECDEKIMHDKALKVFHNIDCPLDSLKDTQNLFAEANFWEYIKKAAGHNLSKTQLTKHYMSDLKSGFIMTEFCDSTICQTKFPLNLVKIFKVVSSDLQQNALISDKIYDVGGFRKLPDFINDKVTLRYYKKLKNQKSVVDLEILIARIKLLINNPKTPHREKIRKALELFLSD